MTVSEVYVIIMYKYIKLEGGGFVVNLPNANGPLKELDSNIVQDVLNFEDTSVGIYSVTDLTDWASDGLVDYVDITPVYVSKENAIIKCEGVHFEIYLKVEKDGDEVIDSKWAIRLYNSNKESV